MKIAVAPVIETDSTTSLIANVESGQLAAIVPRSMLEIADLSRRLRVLPIVDPEISRTIGVIVSERFPIQPTVESLIEQARAICPPELLPAN